MALRFLDNPKHDPLMISATSGEDGEAEDNGEGVESVDASDEEFEEGEGAGAGDADVTSFEWKMNGILSNAFHIQAAMMPPPSNPATPKKIPAKGSPAKRSPAKRSPAKRSPAKRSPSAKPRQAVRTRSRSRGGGPTKGKGGKGKGGSKSPSKTPDPPPGRLRVCCRRIWRERGR